MFESRGTTVLYHFNVNPVNVMSMIGTDAAMDLVEETLASLRRRVQEEEARGKRVKDAATNTTPPPPPPPSITSSSKFISYKLI